ncbi:MAG: hypothetical protein J0M04_18365 [Verrucomicrobia bacterium]|nr:hypothetical protein [Verrucomicrobiota bacterium]
MLTLRNSANLAATAILLAAIVLLAYMWRTGAGKTSDDGTDLPGPVPNAPPPRETARPLPVPIRKTVPAGSFWMKCEAVLGHAGINGSRFDTDCCGWKQATVDGTKRWYQLFVQTVVISDAIVDGSYGYGETRITFSARGRHAAVPCGGNLDMVSPPPDDSEGNGRGNWSAWHEFKQSVIVSCDPKTGAITARSEGGLDGDDFPDGFHLTAKLAAGSGPCVECEVIPTHPFGGTGDRERAMVRFSSVRRVEK